MEASWVDMERSRSERAGVELGLKRRKRMSVDIEDILAVVMIAGVAGWIIGLFTLAWLAAAGW